MKLTASPLSRIVQLHLCGSARTTAMTRLPALTALAFAAIATAAFAQVPPAVSSLGAVKEVTGVVTMSVGSQVATVQVETPIYDGSRFVASSAGNAQLRFENGCLLHLKPNEWVTIDSSLDCTRQIAAIHTVTNVAAGGLFAGAGGSALPLLGLTALTAVVKTVQEAPVSLIPN